MVRVEATIREHAQIRADRIVIESQEARDWVLRIDRNESKAGFNEKTGDRERDGGERSGDAHSESSNDQHEELSHENHETRESIERNESVERTDRMEQPEKVERAEQPEKVERPEQPEKVERPEPPEKPEKPEKD
jgi:hypothetical protein